MPTKRKKTVTKKQIEANRRNAKKSTGPKTPEGKLRSALNATTHGLTAKALVFENDPAEKLEDFITFHAELQVDLKPVGRNEEALVQRIAICLWRLNRAYRFEAASVAAARAATEPEAHSSRRSAAETEARVSSCKPLDRPQRSRTDDAPTNRPIMPKQDRTAGKSKMGNRQLEINPQSAIANPQSQIVLPNTGDLDRLIRYEGRIDRELHRTFNQLDRLRTLRLKNQQTEDPDEDNPEDDLEFAKALSKIARLQSQIHFPNAATPAREASSPDSQSLVNTVAHSPNRPASAKPTGEAGKSEIGNRQSPAAAQSAGRKPQASSNSQSAIRNSQSPSALDKPNPPAPPADPDDAPRPPSPRRHWMPPRG